MTPTRKRRLIMVLLIIAGLGTATSITLVALRDNLLFFQSPSDIYARSNEQGLPVAKPFRLGGLVQIDSVERDQSSLEASFKVTDGSHSVAVSFEGILPDLFQEGQGIIAIGKLNTNCEFHAEQVLAKHDETYIPKEVAEALEHNSSDTTNLPEGQKQDRERIASMVLQQSPLRFNSNDNTCVS